ncbi:MAG: tetratricopeptide repeat protein [Lentisphaerae bacterium]|nr:tetratricopeptide repeat protein [Lentisphaerota bacterium]
MFVFITQIPLFLAQTQYDLELEDSGSLLEIIPGWLWLALPIILAFICLLHIIKTRQDLLWIFLVLFFPLMGSLIYILAVMLNSGESTAARPRSKKHFYQDRVRFLQKSLEKTDTLALWAELGEAYLQIQEPAKAKECFRRCLQGAYSQDPYFLYGMAQACYALQELPEALEAIEKNMQSDSKDYLLERKFLQAKILDDLGRYEEALDLYDEVADKLATPESHCRQAVVLKRLGHQEEAEVLFLAVIRQVKTLPREQRSQNQQWLLLAQKMLSES